METNPLIQNQKLARSINLGNILDAPEEGAWGLYLEASYFEIISEAGFSAVRLPVRWSAHTDTTVPYTIDSDFLSRVDWAIDQALEHDLSIVVNVHHFVEMNSTPHTHLPRLLAIWEQLAIHFKDRPDNLILELFNEPNDAFTWEVWNSIIPQLIEVIRLVDPDRTLMVGTAPWGGIDGLDNLQLPPDSNLIVTIHYYNPFHFTHQGAEWVDGSDAWLGTTWGLHDSDSRELISDLDLVSDWSVQHQRPIFVGEFGAYSRAKMDYRYHWTEQVVSLCESHNFSWAYWEFASGFGAYNLETNSWNELLSALIQD